MFAAPSQPLAVQGRPHPAGVVPEPSDGPPDQHRWYLRVSGVESGPVTWDALRQLAREGALKATDDVRRTDEVRWVPAAQARCPERDERPAPSPRRPTVASVDDARPLGRQALGPATVSRPSPAPAPAPVEGRPSRAARPAGTALLALGLSLAGLIAFALPLGLLAVYLGTSSAIALLRARSPVGPVMIAMAAVAVGLADAGFSLWVIGGRAAEVGSQVVAAGR